jgi:phospholipase C
LIANPNPTTPPSDNPQAINMFTNDQNWVNCDDFTQPGVAPILEYLSHLPYHPKSNCAPGHYYLINNSGPGYNNDGTLSGGVPPSTLRTIGDELNEHNIGWKFFGADFKTQYYYCAICNPFQYMKSVMGDPAQRAAHLGDSEDLINAIQTNTLPAVSFGKPDGYMDGHPQSSKVDLFETYVQNILAVLQNHPEQLADTVVFVTFDEAGGEYDSGFVQPIDFFGDGPRIPLLVLSPYSTGGIIHHAYGDHVSLLKFIERNWHLQPLTKRSRDNLPNPVSNASNPYVPTNSPAIDDLFDAFNWNQTATPNYLP